MDPLTFEVVLERPEDSGSATFIRVPFDVPAVFGQARPPVRVTIGAHTYPSTVAVYGGEYFLPVNRAHREAAGVDAGDTVSVTLAYDEGPRVVELAPDVAEAFEAAGVLPQWSQLAYSHQREYATWIEDAKRPDTRARRILQATERVGEARPRR